MFSDFIEDKKIYSPGEIRDIIERAFYESKLIKASKGVQFFDTPCSFDIETSSFFRSTGKEKEKCACMYEFTLGFNGLVLIGRTWEEFEDCINVLSEMLQTNAKKRVLIYVHNLSYEFQFICKRFEWEKVFSIDQRKPIYAITTTGIEFRCSYLLSGYSLEKLGEQLQRYNVSKLTGNLDYKLIRHSKTPLTPDEIAYCVNDVRVVMAYIKERSEIDGSIANIPITKTGYVRNYCRGICLNQKNEKGYLSKESKNYRILMDALTIEPEEYRQLKRCFQGGFTHACPLESGLIKENVTSFDFTSSYPAVLVMSNRFPMSKGELITIDTREKFDYNIARYACIFDVMFIGLDAIRFYDNYISVSRCRNVTGSERFPVVENNGRLVSAESITLTITEIDFEIIRKFYTWEEMHIGAFRRYERGYLPTPLVKSILKLYGDKTTLKGVEGKEIEYLSSKEMINAVYGMMVTAIVRDNEMYTDHWYRDKADVTESIEKYNKSKSRFLFYPWGVYCTALARYNLFTGISEFGNTGDYIYSDTDSVKVINAEEHREYIEGYNNYVIERLKRACEFHNIPFEMVSPKTIKGEVKTLGLWDFDGFYKRFKTLGAKRYMVEHPDGKLSITVSGLNKKICVPYLLRRYKTNNGCFRNFSHDLWIPPQFTGKITHTYIDDPIDGVIIDYLGNKGEYHELSFVHLIESEYSLSIARKYSEYIRGIQKNYI